MRSTRTSAFPVTGGRTKEKLPVWAAFFVSAKIKAVIFCNKVIKLFFARIILSLISIIYFLSNTYIFVSDLRKRIRSNNFFMSSILIYCFILS